MKVKLQQKKTSLMQSLLNLFHLKITEAINFDSADPDFSGEMITEITFELKKMVLKLRSCSKYSKRH